MPVEIKNWELVWLIPIGSVSEHQFSQFFGLFACWHLLFLFKAIRKLQNITFDTVKVPSDRRPGQIWKGIPWCKLADLGIQTVKI